MNMQGRGSTIGAPSPQGMQMPPPPSMSPLAMNNLIGNPMANGGSNSMRGQQLMQPYMPSGSGQAYARGGLAFADGGGAPPMPPPQQGGLAQAAEAGVPPGEPPMEEGMEEGAGGELAELAEQMKQEGLQLVYVSPQILMAMVKLLGQPNENEASGLPEFTSMEKVKEMVAQRQQAGGGAPPGAGPAGPGAGAPPEMG